MRSASDLARILTALDGRGYASYKQLLGSYELRGCRLAVDHVQVDPYAPPSRMRLVVAREVAGIPPELTDDAEGRVAVADFLTRALAAEIRARLGERAGVSVGRPGQEVLERTSVLVAPDRIEARISVALPASGRRARGREAAELLSRTLPDLAQRALRYASLDPSALAEAVRLYRDQQALRARLAQRHLVAFVGDGAVLPRRSGDSDLPLRDGAVPFASPEELRVSFALPSGREVTGMGVPEGVTVIVGGGYHGKSTLLRALERGVYAHVGGDGREWVITRADAVAIRAEDGRAITDVDIAPFITNLPSGADTRRFTTTNASGSTSQAAGLVEAVAAGSRVLLIDEDTSATNFMIRDHRMRELIPAESEPITPFVDRVRPLLSERGVSTVLVAGGSGAFFDVADHVIAMASYVPRDVTARARAIAQSDPVGAGLGTVVPDGRTAGGTEAGATVAGGRTDDASVEHGTSEMFPVARPRIPRADALRPPGKTKAARAQGRGVVRFGHDTIDLTLVSQLLNPAQTEGVALALDRLADLLDGELSVAQAVSELDRRIDAEGLDALSTRRGNPGTFERPRVQEIAAALNRYRGLRLRGN